MMGGKLALNFLSGNRSSKGFIFALDAAIAVAVIIIMLIDSSYYFSTASRESLSHVQVARLSADALAMVDYLGSASAAVEQDVVSAGGYFSTQQSNTLNLSRYMPAGIAFALDISDLQEAQINNSAVIQGGAVCGLDHCNLTNAGGRIRVNSLNISQADDYTVAVHVVVRKETTLFIDTVPGLGSCSGTDTSSVQVNVTGVYVFPRLLCIRKGVNRVEFRVSPAGDVTLAWYRVVGAPEHRKTSSTAAPIDRFVATSERIILAKYNDTLFPHVFRGYAWLK